MMKPSTSIMSSPRPQQKLSSSLIPTKTKKTKKKTPSSSNIILKHQRNSHDDMAAAYKEDLGAQGVKNKLGDDDKSANIHRLPVTKDEKSRRVKRMARFGIVTDKEPGSLSSALSSSRSGGTTTTSSSKNKKQRTTEDDLLFTTGADNQQQYDTLVGTSTTLEKPYLRLTTFPKAENVRPQPILVKSLAHIKLRFIQNEDFDYANEQLKSVRQDITVQRLRNKFVLEVYETHARILLEHGSLDEFNQCQTMIRNLTTGHDSTSSSSSSLRTKEEDDNDEDHNGIHNCEHLVGEIGKLPCLKQTEEATDEFRAYGLLYALVQNSWSELTRGFNDAIEGISRSSPSTVDAIGGGRGGGDSSSSIYSYGSSFRHAVQVVKAVLHHDYQAFFRLYESAPHLSAYLMDFLVRRVREAAYERIIAAYRPTMSVEHFREALYFQDLEETRRFLQKSGAVFMRDDGGPPFWVDCKASSSGASSSSSSS